YALGELEAHRPLLGRHLAAREPRRLQLLARAHGLLERRAACVQRRAVRYGIDRQLARRVRVRERADTVGAHALGEPHRLLMSGGGAVAAAAAGAGGSARTARDDDGEHGKAGQRPECSPHGLLPIRGGRGRGRRSGLAGTWRGDWPAMRSTMASAAARPAATLSSPGCPSTTPVIVVRL